VVSVDFTLVLFTASFILFIYLMNLLFFSPLRTVINSREGKIKANRRKTESLVEEVESKIEAFKDDEFIKNARAESSRLISEANSEAANKRQALINETAEQLKQKKAKNHSAIEKEKSQILKNLEGPIKEITHLMVGKVLSNANDIQIQEEIAA